MHKTNVPVFGDLVPHPPREPPPPPTPKPRTLSFEHILPSVRRCSDKAPVVFSETVSPLKFQSPMVGPEAQQKIRGQSIAKFENWKTVYPFKVQLPFKTVPGQIPRKLKIERCRREYLSLDLEQLLADKGITSSQLMTGHQRSGEPGTIKVKAVASKLPLEIFDNEDYDCRTPEEWLTLCKAGTHDKTTVCGKALLPTTHRITSETSPQEFSWHPVVVLDFSKEKYQYFVQKVQQSTMLTAKTTKQANAGYWVPRIRLCFTAEDPRVFVERIQHALSQKDNAVALCMYNSAVDYMPIYSRAPSLHDQSLERIKRRATSAPGLHLKKVERCLGDLEKEVKRGYTRTMDSLSFDHVVGKEPEEFPHITLPQKDPDYVPRTGCVPVPYFDYENYKAAFSRKSLLRRPEVINARSEIWQECDKVAAMKLFSIPEFEPLQLHDFESMQSEIHSRIHIYLKDNWVRDMRDILRSHLGCFRGGDYSLDQSSWIVFKLTRLYRLLVMVRIKMQECVCTLVENSLLSLTHILLDACHGVLTCPQDLVWGNDLITSAYKPKENPLFLLDLVLDQTGVHYSTPPGIFEKSLINMFDKAISATYYIQRLDKFVMTNLTMSDEEWLNSVRVWEPIVVELKEKVRIALIQATIPLRAYAAEYEKYLELHNLDVNNHIKAHSNDDITAETVKTETEQHLQDKELIERSLPLSIVIGPFLVHVETVRKVLSDKKKALANAGLRLFAQKLRKQVDDACEECNEISRKLNEKPSSIEELTEKREFMKQIPEKLIVYKELLGKTLTDYSVLDKFLYCISNEDFDKKWTAIGWPQRIINQMEDVTIQNENNEQLFREIQLADQDKFEERLTSLQILVAGFASHTEIDRASELADKMKQTNRQIEECLTLAETYNSRERLFGIPVTNYNRLQKLAQDFQPFKDLWITTASWLYWHEHWFNGPLSYVLPERLQRKLTEARKAMEKCVQEFEEIPDCQSVAATICRRIEDFLPQSSLILALRSPGMKGRHWEMLSERVQVKLSADLSFSRCLELGLMDHVDDVNSVVEVAEKEIAIEQALEKMEEEWSEMFFELLPYKDTNTFSLENSEEALRLLDEHKVTTQSLNSSPFVKTFKGRIQKWEDKLGTTQMVLKDWMTCQESWLHLKPIFSSDDMKQELPAEEKTFQEMEKFWRIVTDNAFKNKKVIDGSTARKLYRLRLCNKLLKQAQKGVTEYMKTQ